MNAEEIAALVSAAVARTEKEKSFVEQMRGKTECSPKQLHWLRALAARAEKMTRLVDGEIAKFDLSNVISFPGYLCHGKQITHACIVYADIDSFAAAISEKDYSRSLAWDRARRARKGRLWQQQGGGGAA
jgi:hypothetical protein